MLKITNYYREIKRVYRKNKRKRNKLYYPVEKYPVMVELGIIPKNTFII